MIDSLVFKYLLLNRVLDLLVLHVLVLTFELLLHFLIYTYIVSEIGSLPTFPAAAFLSYSSFLKKLLLIFILYYNLQ